MFAPTVSFCVPTFNRNRYLECLLTRMNEHLAAFPYPYEVVVADNASSDRTAEVIDSFVSRLPIRRFRHAENIGGYANLIFTLSQGQGRYLIYLADDDYVIASEVAKAIARMESAPGIAVTYAPWILFDQVASKNLGTFFEVPHDMRIGRGQYRQLLDRLLEHQIFPEIQIVRRDVWERLMPRVNEMAYYAFVHATDCLAEGDILIQAKPFYISVTNYFADDVREQVGKQEVEHAWDRYRGGLEYLMGRAGEQVDEADRPAIDAQVNELIAARMSVAVRLRYRRQRNPIDTHAIAIRLLGLGFESPVPLAVLARQAALYFLLTDTGLHYGATRILCLGHFDDEQAVYMRQWAALPLEFTERVADVADASRTLVYARTETGLASTFIEERAVRIVTDADLLRRFER